METAAADVNTDQAIRPVWILEVGVVKDRIRPSQRDLERDDI